MDDARAARRARACAPGLDYGAGPGVLALALQKLGTEVKVWDINPEMREKAAAKISRRNVYGSKAELPAGFFDVVICNLVLCIVPEEEVRAIVDAIQEALAPRGVAYIGFCNPKIFRVRESRLDLRFPSGKAYEENHDYRKVKKEGRYEIVESHRPIEWYERVFAEAGLQVAKTLFTPEYELNGDRIEDFVIFQLRRK